MAILCPTCGIPVPAPDIDRKRMIAHCRGCASVFDCSNAPVSEGAPLGPQRRRPRVPMPESFTVSEGSRELAEGGYREAPRGGPPLTIVRRWYHPVAFALLAFFVVWNVGLYNFIFGDNHAPFVFRLFPVIHVAAGLAVFYSAMALLFNRTTIVVRDDELSIAHGPIPWRGNCRIPTADLEQLYTEERIEQRKNDVSRHYDLSAVMKGGARKKLVKGLPEPAQALFLEQRIEERLGIIDVAVGGEYRG